MDGYGIGIGMEDRYADGRGLVMMLVGNIELLRLGVWG